MMLTYISLFLVAIFISFFYVTWKQDNISKALFYMLLAVVFSYFLTLSIITPYDLGKDFFSYNHWYNYAGVEDFNYLLSLKDPLLRFYYKVAFYFIGYLDVYSVFDNDIFILINYFWFLLILSPVFFSIGRLIGFREAVLFAFLLISSRLFWEYSNNTIRSFSAVIFLFNAMLIFLANRKVTLGFVFYIILASLCHFVTVVLICLLFVISYIFSKVFIKFRFIYIFLVILFLLKAFSVSILNDLLELIVNVVHFFQDNLGFKLHLNKISSEIVYDTSLIFQYLVYVYFPCLLYLYAKKNSSILGSSKYKAIGNLVGIYFFSIFLFPEVFLVERVNAFLLLISMLMTVGLNRLYTMLPILIFNIITIFSIVSQSGIL